MRGLTKGTAMICQHTNDYVQQQKKSREKVEREGGGGLKKRTPTKGSGGGGTEGKSIVPSLLADNVEKVFKTTKAK